MAEEEKGIGWAHFVPVDDPRAYQRDGSINDDFRPTGKGPAHESTADDGASDGVAGGAG